MTRIVSLNVRSGGFNSYSHTAHVPEREKQITDFLAKQRDEHGVTTAALQDTFRWDSQYDGAYGIAQHTGFKHAHHVRLGDESLGESGAPIGLTTVTSERVQQSRELDLGTRRAQAVILDVGKYGLRLVNAYLHHASEDIRKKQAERLVDELRSNPDELEVPTIITMDGNMLRPTLEGAPIAAQMANFAIRVLLGNIRGLNRREVVSVFERAGYTDADTHKRPTFPSRLPVFGVDYVWSRGGATVTDFTPIYSRQARNVSDHVPLRFSVQS